MKLLPRRTTRALTLAEVIGVIGITATIIGATGVVTAEVVRLHGAQGRYYARLDGAQYLLRRFARDVRCARGIVERDGADRASPATLILRHESNRVLYRVLPGRVERVQRAGDRERVDRVLTDTALTVTFSENAADSRTTVCTVQWDEDARVGVSHPILSLRAAPRAMEAR